MFGGRKMNRVAVGLLLLMTLFGSFPARAADGSYAYSDIHPAGWLSSYAASVNSRGDVAGYGLTSSGERGFLWSRGAHTEILPPGATGAKALWVNGNGDVAGTALIDGNPRAFLFREGIYSDPTPGWACSEALFLGEDGAVAGTGEFGGYVSRDGSVEVYPQFISVVGTNSAGQILGSTENAARLYLPGQGYLDLCPPGADVVVPKGINESGLVAISSRVAGSEKGYVYSGGFYVFMIPTGWSSSTAMAVNGLSQVVGYGTAPEGRRSFLRTGSVYKEIAFPGWTTTEAVSLNDSGNLAGSGETADGQVHAFLAAPAATPVAAGGETSGPSGSGGCSMAHGKRTAPEAAASLLVLLFPGLLLAVRKGCRAPRKEVRQETGAYSPRIFTRTRFLRPPSNSP